MVIWTSSPILRAYARVVASAAGEAVVTGIWVMAGELPPGKRRLARVGLTATIAAIGVGLSLLEPLPEEPSPEDESMLTPDEPDADSLDDPTQAERPVSPVVGTAAGGIGVAIMIGSSLLQKRWLASLARSGHAHPHRSLALRVAAISFAGTLPARLMEVGGQVEVGGPVEVRGQVGD